MLLLKPFSDVWTSTAEQLFWAAPVGVFDHRAATEEALKMGALEYGVSCNCTQGNIFGPLGQSSYGEGSRTWGGSNLTVRWIVYCFIHT